MSTRREAERERLREHRQEKERQEAAAGRRRLVATYAAAGVVAAIVVAGIVIAIAGSNGGGSSEASEDPFGQHFEGLVERRIEANVTTMATPNSAQHIHPHLAVYANGKR